MLRVQVVSVDFRSGGEAPVILLREFGGGTGPALRLYPSLAEAHDLFHEHQGAETTRAQAHALLDRALRALGARPAAVRLFRSCGSCLAAHLLVEREGAWVDLDVETFQGIALAERLRLPLWADPDLFSTTPAGTDGGHVQH